VIHFFFLLLFSQHGGNLLVQLPNGHAETNEKRIAFEIIETPEESRSQVPPDQAQLLSDKNSMTRNEADQGLPNSGLPYSEGEVNTKTFPSIASVGSQGVRSQPQDHEGKESTEAEETVNAHPSSTYSYNKSYNESYTEKKFNRNLLLGRRGESPMSDQRPAYNQREFSADQLGGFSFNTYAWDFAPYLIELKRRIERNIYPPPAFTQLGFGGNNILRFRIFPGGQLEGPEVLGFKGEKALVETSRKSIQVSAPFNPLPDNFPEAYLEVTARFEYYIFGRD